MPRATSLKDRVERFWLAVLLALTVLALLSLLVVARALLKVL